MSNPERGRSEAGPGSFMESERVVLSVTELNATGVASSGCAAGAANSPGSAFTSEGFERGFRAKWFTWMPQRVVSQPMACYLRSCNRLYVRRMYAVRMPE
ncbi:MAG: hypothetical protein QUS14_01980 [Pyrinomonadaceae bacterium]|nr:hypothetical protein [Pyrinomonadaceae bacterium]